jgi:predicted RNA binding protein YcfA (HicA-like mRNA interferase family)
MKHLRKIIKAAKKQGWQVDRTKNSHLRFIPPDKTKRAVYTGGTPSDNRALQNLIKDLMREGLKL